MRKIKEILDETYDGEVMLFDNPSYDDAFIGLTDDGRAVYDYDKMVQWLVDHEGMTPDEAADFVCYNASYHVDDMQPLIVTMPPEVLIEIEADKMQHPEAPGADDK